MMYFNKLLAIAFLFIATSIHSASAHEITVIRADETSSAYAGFDKALEAMTDNAIIYIDLTFKAGEGYELARRENCRDDIFGPVSHKDDQEFQLRPITNDNHSLLSIYPGSKIAFPFNDVSCAYNSPTPTSGSIRFRGFYAVVQHSIPTAVLIELRPISIPANLAMKTLKH